MYVIRKRIKLAPEQAIFLFVAGGTLPPSVATLQSVSATRHAAHPSSRPLSPAASGCSAPVWRVLVVIHLLLVARAWVGVCAGV